MADSTNTGGFSVAETLVALLLGLLLSVLAWRALASVRGIAERLERRGEALDALRTARHVLLEELKAGAPLTLAEPPAADTMAVRALRGVAVVCPGSVSVRQVTVLPDGLRSPDPDKDSAWVVGSDGERALLAIERSESGGDCLVLGSGKALRWTLSGDLPRDPAVALYFEKGSYHLSGSALRYRRGYAGRQPLTPEDLLSPPSRFEAWRGSVAARLVTKGAGASSRTVLPFVSADERGPR